MLLCALLAPVCGPCLQCLGVKMCWRAWGIGSRSWRDLARLSFQHLHTVQPGMRVA